MMNMKSPFKTIGLALAVLVPMGVVALDVTSGTRILGNLYITGSLSKGSGTFVIDHPLYPRTKLLYHSFVESPDMKNLYDGIVTLNEQGEATIELPAYFGALNGDYRYLYMPLGASMPGLHIKEPARDNRFIIGGGAPGGRVSWQVTGIRHDPYARLYPLVVEVEKGPAELVEKGECLHEGACSAEGQ